MSSSRLRSSNRSLSKRTFPLVFATLAEGVGDGSIRGDVPPPLLFLCTMAIGALPQLLQRALQGRGPLAALPPGDALGDWLRRRALLGARGEEVTRQGEANPSEVSSRLAP